MQDVGGIVSAIKERVSCLEAARLLGLPIDRDGFCKCIFHDEKTASLKLYRDDRGYYCYGCGASGDVISLAMKCWGVGFRDALFKMDYDWRLGLNLVDQPRTKRDRKNMERRLAREEMNRQSAQMLQESRIGACRIACGLAQGFRRQTADNAPTGPENGFNKAFADGLRYTVIADALADWLEEGGDW